MIKETIVFRQKELDSYLKNMKELLVKQNKIDTDLKFIKKNKKIVDEEIRKLNNWYRNL